MARGLDVISMAVPAHAISWSPVTPRGDDAEGALITLTGPILVDPAQARREYLERYHHDDPFAPRLQLDSRRTLVTMADVGGLRGLLSTGYGGELLPEHGIAYETALYIRDGAQMLGVVRVDRTLEEGDFSDADLDFLRRVHLFLEGAYRAAREPLADLKHGD